MKLTDLACKSAKPKTKPYKKSDGGGLYLFIQPSGAKYWRLKYRIHGKEKTFSIGTYPLISLLEAREERLKAKKLLSSGIDPSQKKKQKKRQSVSNSLNTFQAIALEWHNKQSSKWSIGHAQRILKRLENDIFPYIGNEPIKNITAPDLLYVLRKIETRGALHLAGRANQVCGQIFRYGIQTGKCERDPSSDLKGALKTKKTTHYATIDAKEIPDFIATLNQNDARLYPRTRRAIKLSMLTFVRPGELRHARWEDIDLNDGQWTIPAEFMKMNRDHIVPLAKQAIELLREQKEETGHIKTDWVFPSLIKPRQPISDATVSVAIKRMGYGGKMTAHGFRALARTTIREKLKYAPDVIECQLAHKASGALGEAYNRAQFLDDRKVMMQDWADYIDIGS